MSHTPARYLKPASSWRRRASFKAAYPASKRTFRSASP
ncbi:MULTISPECIES: hypothetical protein [Paraburkholderia]